LIALDAEAFTDLVRGEISTRQRSAEEDGANPNVTPRGQRRSGGDSLTASTRRPTKTIAPTAHANIGSAAFGIDWNFARRWFVGAGGG
jgi:hypothetical protein